MKKIFAMFGMLLSMSAFAQSQSPQYYIQKCEPKGGVVECLMGITPPSGGHAVMNQYSSPSLNNLSPSAGGLKLPDPMSSLPSVSSFTTPPMSPQALADAGKKLTQGLEPKGPDGKFEDVPGGNPFVFCSGPRPPRGSHWRPVYDRVCKDNQQGPKPPQPPNTPIKLPTIEVEGSKGM